jgi:Ribbon-helix-helix protein, copG family
LKENENMTEVTTRPRRLVQLELPSETVETIDRLAGTETISRTAWIRRLVVQSAKAAEPSV